MPSLQKRLVSILRVVLPVDEERDGALTVRHEGTFASLRVVTIVEDLELVSLTQVVAWDLPLTKKVRDRVDQQAQTTLLGALTLVATVSQQAGGATGTANSGKVGDVMLRYNFPGAGLTDEALRTLILLVLDKGAKIRGVLTA